MILSVSCFYVYKYNNKKKIKLFMVEKKKEIEKDLNLFGLFFVFVEESVRLSIFKIFILWRILIYEMIFFFMC